MPDERIDILRKVALFDGLSDKELGAIAKATKERRFDTGDTIVSEGDSGIGFFVIADGTARVEAERPARCDAALGQLVWRGRAARRRRRAAHRDRDRRIASCGCSD